LTASTQGAAEAERAGLRALCSVVPVSRETGQRLQIYIALLRHWQAAKNLISRGTLEQVWTRHIVDSAQCVSVCGDARRWIDLGSGAGFPGLVIALLLADTPDARVDLVESNGRKSAFLRAVIRETGAPAVVHSTRIEQLAQSWTRPIDAVCARALAPLPKLLELAAPFLGEKSRCVFHKGQDFVSEMKDATQYWGFDLVEHISRTDSNSRILVMSKVHRQRIAET
jgi:16S rRNA (guanine527-N7)-methyltransferase